MSHGALEWLNPPFATMAEPTGDGAIALYDYAPSWEWIVGYLGCVFALGLGLFVALGFGAAKKGRRAVLALTGSFLLSAALRLVALASSAARGRRADALLFGLWLVYDACNCAYFACVERLFVPHEADLLAFSAYLGLMEGLDRTAIHANGPGPGMWVYEVTPVRASIPVFVALSAWLMCLRWSTARWANGIAREDEARFSAAWQDFVSAMSEVQRGALREATCLADQLGARLGSDLRQRFRAPALTRLGSFSFLAGSALQLGLQWEDGLQEDDRIVPNTAFLQGPLVTSLDQLFAQAAGLQHFLIAKVQQWALASRGCFPVESAAGEQSFVPWENVAYDPVARARVLWAPVKSAERALEKLLRSLQNDPSRLLDCCRQRIIFEEPGHLLQCLDAVRRDEDVRVVRVKNRLHNVYSAATKAGCRDVLLNLRIDTDETRRLGIETHVCEVQLSLSCLVKLITDEGHTRYLILRNVRRSLPLLRELLLGTAPVFLGRQPQKNMSAVAGEYSAIMPENARQISSANQPESSFRNDTDQDTGRLSSEAQRLQTSVSPAPATAFHSITCVSCVSSTDRQIQECNYLKSSAHVVLSNHGTQPTLGAFNSHVNAAQRQPYYSNTIQAGPCVHEKNKAEGLRETIETQYKMRCKQKRIDQRARLRFVWKSIAEESFVSLLLTKSPLSAAVSRPRFQYFCVVFALLFLCAVSLNARAYNSSSQVSGRFVRFYSPGLPSVITSDSATLLLNGLTIRPMPIVIIQNSSTQLVIEYCNEVTFNGWRLYLQDGLADVSLEASDDGRVWSAICSGDGVCRQERFAVVDVLAYCTRSWQQGYYTFDLRPKWSFVADSVLVPVVGLAMMSSLAIAGYCRYDRFATWIIATGCMLISICYAVSAGNSLRSGEIWRACVLLVLTFSAAIWCMCPLLEEHAWWLLGLHGIIVVVIHAVAVAVAGNRQFDLPVMFPVFGCIELLIWINVGVVRMIRYTAAWRKAQHERLLCDTAWDEILSRDVHQQNLHQLAETTRTMGMHVKPDVRQRVRRREKINGGDGELDGAVLLDIENLEEPLVTSLDQLFAQAEGLQHFLIAKVQQWALASRGCFPVESAAGEQSFVPWENVAYDPVARARVLWAPVKSAERALEKLLRSLQNDPSRLLDCCRQRIIFEEPGHLLQCLDAVRRDEDVRVVRVKNRLHNVYSAATKAGCRDVLLNLRIDTDETRRLGIETHICELRMGLAALEQITVRIILF